MAETDICDIQSIIRQWGLTAKSWVKIKDVYKVQTDRGVKNLKVSPLKPRRLAYVHSAVNHLVMNGFTKMYPIIPTSSQTSCVYDQGFAYTLFDWIEGQQCKFKNLSELLEATQIFAEFHQKSHGFEPPHNSHQRKQLGKCLRHFQERYQDLIQFKATALCLPKDKFAQLYLENVDFFLPMAAKALEKLNQSSYWDLVEWAHINKPFCHGDPAARNFIQTPEGRIFMIDFDSCRFDLPVMDLIKFTRRVMKKYHWNFEIAQQLLEAYHEVYPLNDKELELMKAVYYFPQKFWRLAVRHFHQHGRHTPERAIQKFRKYLQNKEAFAQFQVAFEHYQPRLEMRK